MRAVVLVLVLGVALAMPLSGCLGGAEDPEPSGEENGAENGGDGTPPEGGGTGINGRVLTESFEPIKGAAVRVYQAERLVAQTLTDDAGRYEVDGLEPGEAQLRVSAPCCMEQILRLNLPAGAMHKQDVRLDELPRIVGHVVEEVWNGFIGCSGRAAGDILFNPDGACANTDPNNDPIHQFELRATLMTVVVAMEWEQATTNLLDDLHFVMSKNNHRFFTLSGESPLQTTVGPEDAAAGEELYFENIENPWSVRFVVTAGDPNIVYQQPFTVHYHLYYVDPAPEGASALPS